MQFYMDKREKDFLLDNLRQSYDALEYGSGGSTIEIQNRVNKLVSIEHDKNWYTEVSNYIVYPTKLLHIRPNNELWERQFDWELKKNVAGDDGSFEDFYDYVTTPMQYGPYDIVFVDGRARVACATFAAFNMLKPWGKIFIHDFGPEGKHPVYGYRKYYDLVYQWLEVVEHVGSMYCFKVKK